MRCPDCDTVIPHAARFCPKCGKIAPADAHALVEPRMAANAVPSTGALPRIGKIFLVALLAGLGLMVGGGFARSLAMFLCGVGVIALVVLISLVGDLVA